ncbi:MAG: pilus assembly protein [Archangiaceae bacterium]|nr:pilus assembly protein [Archangiaceae bacterium]
MIFLFLGTLQLFLCYQARLMALYAASRAVSAGSRNHANCGSMNDAALAALLPVIETFGGSRHNGSLATRFGEAFAERNLGRPYATFSGHDGLHSGASIFWLVRDLPGDSEETFDAPNNADRTLALRMVFWYPMRIPFADWVLSSMFRAHYNLQDYVASNPLLSAEKAHWKRDGGYNLNGAIGSEMQLRASSKQYVFPITVGWAMRMMTPVRNGARSCPPAPGGL